MSKSVAGKVDPQIKKNQLEFKKLDGEIVESWSGAKLALTRTAKLLARMHETKLWTFSPKKFARFEDYVCYRVGDMAHGKIFDLLNIHTLTEGENPISAESVEKMGIKKATQVARLEPQHRTPEIIKSALTDSVDVVKRKVQEVINLNVPEEDRKEFLEEFTRNLMPATIALIEEIEMDGIYMKGIADGDPRVTLRAKLWHAIVVNFKQNYLEELNEGAQLRVKKESANTLRGSSKPMADDSVDEVIPEAPAEMHATV
jgi:hypothetical protein